MDPFLELEKYKKFLDEGVISEDEFRRVKQKILGLKTDEEKELEQQREDTLEEIRRSRLKEDGKEPPSGEEELLTREQDNLERLRQLQYEKTFSEEKAREKARLEAMEESQNRQRAKQREAVRGFTGTIGSAIRTIILWAVTIFCLLECIGCMIGLAKGSAAFNIVTGIFMFIFAILACPFITKKTKDIPKLQIYYSYKSILVFVLIVLFFVLIVIL